MVNTELKLVPSLKVPSNIILQTFYKKKEVLSCKPLSQFKTSIFLICFIFRIRDRLKQFGLYYE